MHSYGKTYLTRTCKRLSSCKFFIARGIRLARYHSIMEDRLLTKQQIPRLHIAEIVQWKGKSQYNGSSNVAGVARMTETASGTTGPDFASRLTPEAFSISGYSHKAVEV